MYSGKIQAPFSLGSEPVQEPFGQFLCHEVKANQHKIPRRGTEQSELAQTQTRWPCLATPSGNKSEWNIDTRIRSDIC